MIHRLVISFFVFFSCFNGVCQYFAPNEAEWTYTRFEFDGSKYPSRITVEGDTVIVGKSCKKVKIHDDACLFSQFQSIGNQFLYIDSSKVYWYNDSTVKFHLLYDFDAQVNDGWYIVPTTPSDSVLITVDSINGFDVNGTVLNRYYISYSFGNISVGTSFTEKFGFDGYLFPVYSFCDPSIGGIRCYYDSIMNQVVIDSAAYPSCDSIYVTTGIGELLNSNQIDVYPNPFSTYFKIKIPDRFGNYSYATVHNLTGTLIMFFDLLSLNEFIETKDFESGIYFLSIYNDEKILSNQKLIKL